MTTVPHSPSRRRRRPDAAAVERRKDPRVQLSVRVDFRSSHNFYCGKTRDMSAGGLFIETEVGLAVGTMITVDLHLLKTQVKIPCEVVWVLLGTDGRTEGLGVRFIGLAESMRQRIEAFIGLRAAIDFDMGEADEPEAPQDDPSHEAPAEPAVAASRKRPPPLPKGS